MFVAETELPDVDNYDLSSLRTGVMAGAPCPLELMHKVIGKLNMSEITISAKEMSEPVSMAEPKISDWMNCPSFPLARMIKNRTNGTAAPRAKRIAKVRNTICGRNIT